MTPQSITRSRRPVSGNAIAEYVLIGVLIMSASIFALMAFGKSFASNIGIVKADAGDHAQQARAIAEQLRDDAALSSVTTVPGLTGANGFLGDSLPHTTGSNGDTLSTGIDGAIAETDADGNPLSPEEAELKILLQDLSNHAHEIAQLENMLSIISEYSNGNLQKFQSTTIYYGGRIVNAYQLSYALSHGGEVKALQQTKDQILASGASTDIKSDVSNLTNEVVNTAKQAGTSIQGGATDVNSDASSKTDKLAGQMCGRVEGNGNHDNGNRCGSSHHDNNSKHSK